MKIVVINVGASKINPGFRGPIYSNGSFRFVPIKEEREDVERPVTYENLGLAEFVQNKGLAPSTIAHNDPEFVTFTYGHARRGFGDRILWELIEGDCLMFMATLDYYANGQKASWINPRWGAYIIGSFIIERAPLQQMEFESSAWVKSRFQNNAHFRRVYKEADLWIAGSLSKSKPFKTAFPLSNPTDPLEPNDLTRQTFLSNYSKTAGWYRWTLSCRKEDLVTGFLSALKSHVE